MNSGLVSIVLCTYNGNFFIDDQLQSILRQTYNNIEIIISDDVSTDGTYEKLEKFAQKDSRIRLFRNITNLGYNKNFSKACSLANGNYIAIADQDDVWEASKIELLLPALINENNVVLVHCLSANFENINKPSLKNFRFMKAFSGNDIRQLFMRNPISGHSMLLKRELLNVALPFPEAGYYDWWLVLNACCLGEIKAVEKILVWHRVHEGNATGAAKPDILFYEFMQNNLPLLLSIKHIPEKYYKFGKRLLELYKEFPAKKFSYKLFFFLLKNAPVVFAYKKRIFPWFSYARHSYKYSKATF